MRKFITVGDNDDDNHNKILCNESNWWKPVNANSMSKLLIASNGVGKIVVNIFSCFSFIP